MKTFLTVLLAIAVMPAAALANEQKSVNVTAANFDAQAEVVRKEMRPGGIYAEISPEDRDRVSALLVRMSANMPEEGTVDSLHEPQKIVLFNDQDEVNTLLLGAREDSRLVCERVRSTGSNRPTNRCATVAQRRRDREESVKYMRDSYRPSMERGN